MERGARRTNASEADTDADRDSKTLKNRKLDVLPKGLMEEDGKIVSLNQEAWQINMAKQNVSCTFKYVSIMKGNVILALAK